ncbi:spondin domain-containing protein [Psychroserpens sp. MEBiC05023]
MKKITFVLQSLTLITILVAFQTSSAQSMASYTISFSSDWNSVTNDPVNGNSTVELPGNAHWSDLVGATHNNSVTLLEMGGLATTGVKNVAELGNNTAIMNEVQALINDNNADQFLQAGFEEFAPRTSATLMEITVSEDYPLLSLLSMIAPSPDWMIAVNSINLRDGGAWVQSLSIPLFPYDAGTDSGTSYTSANQPTTNPEPISSLVNVAPFNDKPIGTLTITFNQTLNIENPEPSELSIFSNPNRGKLNITTSSTNPLKEALVYDVLGKKVASFKNKNQNHQSEFDYNHLKGGIYLVRVFLQNGLRITKKVILN